MSFKMLKKDKVLTSGNGQNRAVLCLDSKIVYMYHEPEKVLACYSEIKKSWIMPEKPYYSSGGWGSGSSGDSIGHHSWHAARELLNSVHAKVYTLNQKDFVSRDYVEAYNKKAKQMNSSLEKMKKLGADVSEFRTLKPIKLTPQDTRYSEKPLRSGLGMDVFNDIEKLENEVDIFLSNKVKNKNRFKTVLGYSFRKDFIYQGDKILAFRTNENKIYMNSETFSVTNFERNFLGSQSIVQKKLRESANYSVPFNVLRAANLNLLETTILDKGPESDHDIIVNHRNEKRHFTGALLLENKGRKFLMDIDRIEIQHGIFNAFFCEVKPHVKTISEAYETMKPDEVKQAEKSGLEVLRQGEWFFIKTDQKVCVDSVGVSRWALTDEKIKALKSNQLIRQAVSHGQGRPNNLFIVVGPDAEKYQGLVCGVVTHQGREHKPLLLDCTLTIEGALIASKNQDAENLLQAIEWGGFSRFETDDKKPMILEVTLYKLIGNTTVSNFTFSGDID